ncbi:transposon tf2-6 polyprotein [Plakobranchus ocellatus]|uniref:Transposon tf2-6 polyprotein n=1 Tax=Plakobranchus ocellatus TaxID=259542 RepID=A0AAV4DSS7_9GAST|nr:transposon tf2-6 polyprotein [Plakobranchus ocellatus]
MWSPSIEDSFLQAAKWLDLCGRNGIILNPSKFSFAKETVNFAGFEITPTTVRPCPQVLEAIKGFPKPRTITDVRSWMENHTIGSRFTSPAESRYAPIEGEALAVVDALEKTRYFVLGCPNLIIAVDHRSLLKVFGDRSLEAIPNPRLRNLKEKTLKYRFHITHIPGVRHVAADTISRNPVGAANHLSLPDDANLVSTNNKLPTIPHSFLLAIRAQSDTPTLCSSEEDSLGGVSSITWYDIRVATNSNNSMVKLIDLIENGFPEAKDHLPAELRPYYQYRDKLTSFDGVALYNDRVIIPPGLRDKFDQYVIRVDGSGRVTLRNRKFLRLYHSVIARSPVATLPSPTAIVTQTTPGVLTSKASAPATCPKPVNTPEQEQPRTPPDNNSQPPSDSFISDPVVDSEPINIPNTPATVADKSPLRKTALMPNALRALQPHNKPGLKESPPPENRLRLK